MTGVSEITNLKNISIPEILKKNRALAYGSSSKIMMVGKNNDQYISNKMISKVH
jgi:hypothetical protein